MVLPKTSRYSKHIVSRTVSTPEKSFGKEGQYPSTHLDRVEHFDAHWVHQIDHMNKENPRRTRETLDQLVMRNDARPSGVREVNCAPFQLHQIMLKVLQATARMLDVLKLHKALPFRRLYIDARRKLGRERAHESKDVLLGDGARAIPQEKHLLAVQIAIIATALLPAQIHKLFVFEARRLWDQQR